MIRFFCIIVQPSIQLSILELDKAEMLIKVAVNGLSEKCISYASIFCLLQLKACVYHPVQSSQIHTGAKTNRCGFKCSFKVRVNDSTYEKTPMNSYGVEIKMRLHKVVGPIVHSIGPCVGIGRAVL